MNFYPKEYTHISGKYLLSLLYHAITQHFSSDKGNNSVKSYLEKYVALNTLFRIQIAFSKNDKMANQEVATVL